MEGFTGTAVGGGSPVDTMDKNSFIISWWYNPVSSAGRSWESPPEGGEGLESLGRL